MSTISINDIQPTTLPLSIAKAGQIKSAEINSFTQAVSADLASIMSVLNSFVLKMMTSLPNEPGINAVENGLDGNNIYLDSNAAPSVDNGLFYNADQERPLTIKESMALLVLILANMENALREGVSVGSIAAPVTIANASSVSYNWPYNDGMFDSKLYTKSGDIISAANLDITVNYSTRQILITNNTGNEIHIFGKLWHPVFIF